MHEELRDAEQSQHSVRIDRRRGAWNLESILGFVVSVSSHWVAIHRLVDGVYIDGYDVVQIRDVTRVESDDENGYIERTVATLGRPAVDFALPVEATTAEVVEAAAAHSFMVCVHLEMDATDPMLVGHVTDLGVRKFGIQTIDPGGVWDSDPSRLWYGEVTRIAFGDRYSTTLEKYGARGPHAP